MLGYRDVVKMDAQVWKTSMFNELGRLFQGWKNMQKRHNIVHLPQVQTEGHKSDLRESST